MRYEFSEGSSNKFWEIELDGTTVKTTWGKIGTAGQTTTKKYGNAKEARAEHDKLVASKVKKGYAPASAGKATKTKPTSAATKKTAAVTSWRLIKDAKDKPTAVAGYLAAILTEDDADRKVLGKLMKQFRNFSASDDGMELTFESSANGYDGDERSFNFGAPLEDEEDATKLPASLRALAKIHGEITGECGGGGTIGSKCWNDVADYLNDEEGVMGEDIDPGDVPGIFDHGQNLIVGSPTKKNARGEPLLYFIDHEDGAPRLMKEAKSLSARQVFLRLMAQAVIDQEFFANVGE